MVLNPGKCHYSIIDKDITDELIELGKKTLHSEDKQTFLDLNFQSHKKSITKTNQELSALIRVTMFMTDFNKNVIFNYFIKEQFNYCPLLWIFSTTAVSHKIYRLHKRGLRALLIDETLTLMICYQKVTTLLFM